MMNQGHIVANVSVNKFDVLFQGVWRKAIQIGTVMTHPEFRGKGLASCLMDVVLNEYDSLTDIQYLLANKEVVDFYPKFGFHYVPQ